MRTRIAGAEAETIRALAAQRCSPTQIAEALAEKLGARRHRRTISNFCHREGLLGEHAIQEAKVKAVLRECFRRNLSSKEAARHLERETGHRITGNAVCKRWQSMGLRSARPFVNRGRRPVPAHAHPLVRQLIETMNRERTTLTEVEQRAGVRRGTIGRWGRCHSPMLVTFEAALNVLDLELVIRHRKEAR